MSLIPRWKATLPSPNRRASDFFNLGKFFEDLEQDFEAFSSYHSGLSVSSDDKSVYIEAHVPGLTAKEVEVSIDNNNVLWIKGEKKTEEKDKKRKFYRQSQTTFSYCVPLWEEIDTSVEPEAICNEGVMKITFNKKKEKQIEAKKIKVKE
jgi:HSP20 family molecular chaperone IbpA